MEGIIDRIYQRLSRQRKGSEGHPKIVLENFLSQAQARRK